MSDHVEQLLGAIDDRHTELVLPGDTRCSGRGLRRRRHLFHHLVVDAEIPELAGNRAGRRADRSAEERIEKDEADQHAPEPAADRSRRCQTHRLIELDPALVIAQDDDRILKLDQTASAS